MHFVTLGDFLHYASDRLQQAPVYFGHGTDNAWDEAVLLAAFVLQIPPNGDSSLLTQPLSTRESHQLLLLLNERIESGKPLPYLTQEAWFAGLRFFVDERVIIPRSPIAELILEKFQPWLGPSEPKQILDLCTGSGCLAIVCAKMFPSAQITAVDLSTDALEVAKRNVSLHDCSHIRILQSDVFSACQQERYDVIISNPPYVSDVEMRSLPKEYGFEPNMALEAPNNGLAVVQKIIEQAPQYLNDPGLLILEVGNSAEAFEKTFTQLPVTWVDCESGGEGIFICRWENKQWQDF